MTKEDDQTEVIEPEIIKPEIIKPEIIESEIGIESEVTLQPEDISTVQEINDEFSFLGL